MAAIGQNLDALGVSASVSETDLITDAVVILKVLEADGRVRLSTAWSEGMSWIERLGMVTAAKAMEMPTAGDIRSSEDDGA